MGSIRATKGVVGNSLTTPGGFRVRFGTDPGRVGGVPDPPRAMLLRGDRVVLGPDRVAARIRFGLGWRSAPLTVSRAAAQGGARPTWAWLVECSAVVCSSFQAGMFGTLSGCSWLVMGERDLAMVVVAPEGGQGIGEVVQRACLADVDDDGAVAEVFSDTTQHRFPGHVVDIGAAFAFTGGVRGGHDATAIAQRAVVDAGRSEADQVDHRVYAARVPLTNRRDDVPVSWHGMSDAEAGEELGVSALDLAKAGRVDARPAFFPREGRPQTRTTMPMDPSGNEMLQTRRCSLASGGLRCPRLSSSRRSAPLGGWLMRTAAGM